MQFTGGAIVSVRFGWMVDKLGCKLVMLGGVCCGVVDWKEVDSSTDACLLKIK